MEYVKLNDGNIMPLLGFGVFMVDNNGPAKQAVKQALQTGYRLVDTAAAYFNETDVGAAIRESGVPRNDIFVTSKLWLQDYGYEAAKKGIDTSLCKLGLDYIDLYLLHQPYGDTIGAWKALEEGVKSGKIRSIGLSNHTPNLMHQLVSSMEILPAVNQVECNPLFQQKELRCYLTQYGTKMEAWYPLGHADRKLLEDDCLVKIAQSHGKSVVQIILRWHLQEGIITIPKATSIEHIRENFSIFDFVLTEEEMASIRSMDTGKGTYNPEDMSNEARLRNAFDVHANN